MYDLAIIGGGPAGVAAGVYAARKQLKTVFITKDFEGQSSVSEGVENWIGTVKISGADLSLSLERHLKAYAGEIVSIQKGLLCEKITREADGTFTVVTSKGGKNAGADAKNGGETFKTKTILITTGSHRRKLEAIGADTFEHKGLTYCATCDGPLFADQDVAVIGGGNAAFESAAQLLAYCKSVTLINRSDVYRADPITVQKVLEHPKMRVINNAVVKEVFGEKFVTGLTYTQNNTEQKLSVTGIFVEIGSIPTTEFAKDIVKLNQYGNIIVDPRNQRAGENVWAAGDCTDGLYHQNNIAAGDAVKALEDIYVYIKTR